MKIKNPAETPSGVCRDWPPGTDEAGRAKRTNIMKLTFRDYQEMLEGQEVWSIDWATCVGVHNGQFWADGNVICFEPTEEQYQALFSELCENEGI